MANSSVRACKLVLAQRYGAPAVLVAVLVLAGHGLGVSTARAQGEQTVQIVVKVDDVPITNFDIEQRLRFTELKTRTERSDKMRQEVIDALIREQVMLKAARKEGAAAPDEEVNKRIEALASNNGKSVEEFSKLLEQQGIRNLQPLRDEIKANLSWQQLVIKKFRNRVAVGQTEVDRAMADGGGGEGGSSGMLLQKVRLALPQGADQRNLAARLIEADRLRGQVKSCEGLPELVKRIPNATITELKNKSPQDLPSADRTLIMAASEGQMTPPVFTSSGVELYALCSKKPAAGRAGETDQRRDMLAKMRSQRYDELGRGYLRDLMDQASVERTDQKSR